MAGPARERIYWRNVVYFSLLHLLPFGALVWRPGWDVFVAAAVLYWVRIWFVTAGYHCYFSHRSFKTSRAFQLVLAVGAAASGQGSALRWSTAHRYHHANSDEVTDLHSPVQRGFWYSHMGWLLTTRYLGPSTPKAGRFLEYPELRWLDRHPNVAPWSLGLLCLYFWGMPGLCIGWALSTIGVYHATFTVNSLSHMFGSRPYDTKDDSRNNWLVAFLMLGGGWHNNHHRHPGSARQGIQWWEWDPTYYALVVLSWFRIVWDIKVATPRARAADEQPTRAAA